MPSYLVLFQNYRRLSFEFWTKNGHFAFLSPPPLWGLGQRTLFILGSLESS